MKFGKTTFQILAVLSLFMHIAAQLSPLWASESAGFQIQICSGNTFQTITIDENGNEIPAKPTIRMHDCAFCAASLFTATPAQNELNSLPPGLSYIKYNTRENAPPHSPKARAHRTRAPPTLS